MIEENMSYEELKKLQEENIEIDEDSFEVNNGVCCNEKMIKIVDNRNLFEGALTFHIIKLKCSMCGKEYMDLDQAEKYDLLLKLEKQPIEILTKKILA